MWLNMPTHPWVPDGFPMGSVLYYDGRASGPIGKTSEHSLFFHVCGSSDRLRRGMRAPVAFLEIPIERNPLPPCARSAFGAMKEEGNEMAPGAHLGEWRDANEFFQSAAAARMETVLSQENLAL